MLRAQVGQKPSPAPEAPRSAELESPDDVGAMAADETPAPKRRTTRKAAVSTASETGAEVAPAPKRRSTRKTATSASAEPASTDAGGGADAAAVDAPAPKRRTTRRTTASAGETASVDAATSEAAPKRRTTRKAATGSTDPA